MDPLGITCKPTCSLSSRNSNINQCHGCMVKYIMYVPDSNKPPFVHPLDQSLWERFQSNFFFKYTSSIPCTCVTTVIKKPTIEWGKHRTLHILIYTLIHYVCTRVHTSSLTVFARPTTRPMF